MIQSEEQKIVTSDGRSISATFYTPDETKGAILIAPAMGVSQKYYLAFASWLASKGFLVATFDYFGMGLSRSGDLRDTHVTITDWAKRDCSAMIEALADRSSGKPFYWLGHSLGGQILGLIPNSEHISKAITIASGSGYWLENAGSLKWKVWWLWFVVAPLVTRLYGYFPGKRLGKVGDLPRGVIQQWRKWCLHPEYMVGVEGETVRQQYHSIMTPITSFSFTDDELMSEKNINSLHGFYTHSPKNMIRITPAEIGSSRIGHFGFFKEKFKTALWESHLLPVLE